MDMLTLVFINAEMKCGGRAAVCAFLKAMWEVRSQVDMIFVAESDNRRTEEVGERTFSFH